MAAVEYPIDKEAVYEFLLRNLSDRVSIEGFAYEPQKLGGLYWTLTAISILKGNVKEIVHPKLNRKLEEVATDVIGSSRNADGGFGNAPGHPSCIIATHYAILSLALLDRKDVIDKSLNARFIASMQNEDGSFGNDNFGESDARHVYSSVICLSLFGALESVDVARTVRFLLSCQNLDGGFGWNPKGESHAAASFCCVGALSELEALHMVDLDALGMWLAERQTAGGGCNGRAEKAPDICYSWWVLSALHNIGRFEWFDADKLVNFISKSQNKDDGGISHFPGFMGDVFHTYFALAAMSLIDHRRFGLEEIHPKYATTSHGIKCLEKMRLIE